MQYIAGKCVQQLNCNVSVLIVLTSGPISLSDIRDVTKTMDTKSPNNNTVSLIQLGLEENFLKKKGQT
jgi:hypothetical protein